MMLTDYEKDFFHYLVTMQKSLISVIICHHIGALIDNAIKTVLLSKDVKFEVIVATSNQGDVLRLKSKFPEIKVIEIQGEPANKRNVATKFATGDYFAFFDDDVEVEPYTLFYLYRSILDTQTGMVYGKLLNMEFRNRFDEAGSFLTWSGFLFARCESGIEDVGQFDSSCPILAGKSASCIVRRNTFWKVGGFDSAFGILGEETDLSWRIWLLGYKVMYCPKSVAFHAFNTRFKPATFYNPRRVYFNGCRNYISMLITNLSVKNLIIPLLTQTLVWFVAAIGMILTGKFEAGRYIFEGMGYVISNLDGIIEKRKFVQNMRTVPDRTLLPMITHNPPLSYYVKRLIHYIKTGRHG